MLSWLLSLALVVVVLFFAGPPLLKALIRRRLGGYRRAVNVVDASKPERLAAPRRVAVLGGGVAGLVAAVTLARRGFAVKLYEKNGYLGGKLGSWEVELAPGRRAWVSHGFHAFFPNYWNLNRFLDSLDLRRGFKSIGDYVILGPTGESVRFADIERTPVFNLLALAKAGVFRLGEALKAPGRDLYGVLLEYDGDATFEKWDRVSFADFNRLAKVPPRLKLAFNTFARAFFADEDKLSLAELIKSFHFYYLGQDEGLIYDYPTRDYEAQFLAPIRAELARHGATLALSTPVERFEKTGAGFVLDGETFDGVVLAADVVGARQIITRAAGLPDALRAQFDQLKTGQRYAVLRLWLDKDIRENVPVFVITDRAKVLDAVSAYHRLEQESADDVKQHGGSILELHCYAVPEDMSEETLRATFLEEMVQFFPELQGFQVRHEAWQCKRDFTAFHVGQYATRPTTETGVPGLVCAGDWVKLPFAAMLLEGAAASGYAAANVLLREAGLREEPLVAVPARGLMAGVPAPPGRKILSALSRP
ncbi:MAG: FAD-dependent oxidoreductase [Myxococcota bacterium]